jgi:hypothetical protein
VTIVLPSFRRERESSLKLDNYPLYRFEVSPDDVLSALKIYSLLNMIYYPEYLKSGDELQVVLDSYLTAPPNHHTILIGGPHTNDFVEDALCDFAFRFQPAADDLHLIGPDGREYRIKVENNRIVEDYCLITRRDFGHKVVVVIAGLRAYGQVAAESFLSDEDFYRGIEPLLREGSFQVVIKVKVKEWKWTSAAVVDSAPALPSAPAYQFDGFLCHSHADAARAKELAASLRAAGVRVWLDAERIVGGDDIASRIEEGLRGSRFVLPCISGSLKQSNWCRAEYGAALHREFEQDRKRVIPLSIAGHGPEDVPLLLYSKRRVDVTTPEGVEELIRLLKS